MPQHFSSRAIATRWHFSRKYAWITDKMHGRPVYADVTPQAGNTYTRDTWPLRGRGRGESLSSPRRIAAKMRVPVILDLREKGYTWKQIARGLGFKDKSGPWRAVRRTADAGDLYRFRKHEEFLRRTGLTEEQLTEMWYNLDED